jgi:hypothetical protein
MLDRFALDAQLNDMGQNSLWLPATACPCRNAYSGSADPNCPTCLGKGQFWADSVACTVALTGQQILRQWALLGMWEKGDLVVSLPSDSPAYAMGEFDRLRFVDSTEPFSVVLHPAHTNPLPYAVAQIDRAIVLRGDVVVDLALPYLDKDGRVQWLPGTAPGAEETFTLSGRKHPEYFCYGAFPQDRAHYHGEPLPRRVVLRRFDLFGA